MPLVRVFNTSHTKRQKRMYGPVSEDYDYDSIEYSQEDLANIDAIAAAYFDPPLPQGCPEVRIELEGPVQPHESNPSTSRNNSEPPPIQTYRRNRVLTVTDLVSPMWCEVQFDYGLRQYRSRPLEARPKSFVSGSGKAISVEKKVAAMNDTITKKGKAVHKDLELELGLKQVQVRTTSQEERWALRVINFIAGIEAILVNGYTREIPVFGVVHDQIIVGVIDEVKCHIYSNNKADVASDNIPQTHLDDYLICQSYLKKRFNNKRITYVLQLIDTKTRRTDSLPPPEDTLPSRLQLMLYYRMLSDLVSEYSPFDFSSLWNRLCLDPGRIFSAQFLVDAGLVAECQQERTACLDDLVHLLRQTVEKLNLVGVNQHLQLVYRSQPSRAKKKRNECHQNGVIPSSVISQEERELSLAIEASLKDLGARQNPGESSHQNDSPADVAQPAVNADSSSDNGEVTPPSINGNVNGKATSSHQDTPNNCVDNAENVDNGDTECSKIIGTREFYYDETFLNSHVSDILKWWYGKRKPNGVPIHLSGRCFSCEYNKDCEWREEKAMEFTRSLAQRKSTPPTE